MSVSLAHQSDRDEVISTLVSAFVDDPVERWLYPESEQYRAHFPEFVAAFGGEAFRQQSVWTLSEFTAVALWLAPDTQPDGEAITTVLRQSVSPASTPTCSRYSSRWTKATRRSRTGICPGWESTPPAKERASVGSCSDIA